MVYTVVNHHGHCSVIGLISLYVPLNLYMNIFNLNVEFAYGCQCYALKVVKFKRCCPPLIQWTHAISLLLTKWLIMHVEQAIDAPWSHEMTVAYTHTTVIPMLLFRWTITQRSHQGVVIQQMSHPTEPAWLVITAG